VSRVLEERYGRRERSPAARRVLIAALAVFVAAVVAWAVWAASDFGREQQIRADVVRFTARGDAQAEVDVRVSFDSAVPDDADGVCTVKAFNEQGTIVGRRDITVGPASSGEVRTRVVLSTSERAASAAVPACAVAPS